MRTLLFLIAGLLLMGGFLLLGKLFAGQQPEATRTATWAFIVVWFVIAGANMWAGVARAGYPVSDEVPIFLLIFAVPAAAALLVKWQLL
jgi:hypothetical protein